jgi:hypothetical protein
MKRCLFGLLARSPPSEFDIDLVVGGTRKDRWVRNRLCGLLWRRSTVMAAMGMATFGVHDEINFAPPFSFWQQDCNSPEIRGVPLCGEFGNGPFFRLTSDVHIVSQLATAALGPPTAASLQVRGERL